MEASRGLLRAVRARPDTRHARSRCGALPQARSPSHTSGIRHRATPVLFGDFSASLAWLRIRHSPTCCTLDGRWLLCFLRWSPACRARIRRLFSVLFAYLPACPHCRVQGDLEIRNPLEGIADG